ncbi:OmpA family protein [Sediminicoccus rosea]|jgi:outer membrane protein OmpA-like peptidoglycan-associated protein|uniref:OmpA family protein n=1 Tax=Sediminicoccus rosea TaxID=1225128 RepID=A0ABZ0PL99_9PROT|nr:OmpA family protein [Sediminicoccus rosea]WPB86520.1 OmpA family protein [Sediminicoccus rosea]
MSRRLTPAAFGAALLALAACAETPAPAVTAAPPAPAPAAAPAPTATQVDPNRALPIFFEAWSAFLEEPARVALAEVATYIKANPRIPVLVVGYADPRGSAEANMILSRLRARVVADTLVENGVPRNRIRILYRGATPGFESLESRRVEVRVDRGQR